MNLSLSAELLFPLLYRTVKTVRSAKARKRLARMAGVFTLAIAGEAALYPVGNTIVSAVWGIWISIQSALPVPSGVAGLGLVGVMLGMAAAQASMIFCTTRGEAWHGAGGVRSVGHAVRVEVPPDMRRVAGLWRREA